MAIRKIGTNKYRIIIELGYDILGNRKRKTDTFFGSKQEAIKREAELKNDYYHIGKKINYTDITFNDYSEIYIQKYCVPNIKLVTLSAYRKLLKNINSIIGNKKLRQITPLMLDEMYLQLRIGKDGKQLTYNSQYDYYKLVRAMFNMAMKWDLIDRNPHEKVNNKPKKEFKEKNSYDTNQVNELIKALNNESIKNRALILLTLDSGARRGEICALRWKDIDLENGIVNIHKSLKVVDGIVDEVSTKNDSSYRTIMITDTTINVLKEYQEWQNDYKKKMGKLWKEEDRVFTSKYGEYFYPGSCDHIMRRIVKKYNLSPLCFHELRHTCASLLINNGIDPKTVSKRLGHADVSTTMKIYTHSFESSKIECANKMNKILKKVEI